MSLNTRLSRNLTRSLAIAFAVACGIALSSSAHAQMVAGSGCTNCGGASTPVMTYSAPTTTHYAQPMADQSYYGTSYPVGTTVSQGCGTSACSGCASSRRHSSSRHSFLRNRQSSRSCGARYTNSPVYSSGYGCSSGVSYTSGSSYPSSSVVSYGTPVMQTGAGCAGGNCQ